MGNPANQFLKDFWVILSQFLAWFSQLFEETGNLEKCNPSHAKPLFLSIQRQGFSSFFHAFSKTSSRTGILSNFDRILAIWALHLETFGSTFGGHFFRSQKSQKVFFVSDPGSGLSWTHPGEGGNWEASGRHLGQRRPGRGSEGNCAKTCVFFCRKWRARPFRVHESDLTLTKSAACAQKLASDRGDGPSGTLMDILT